MLPYSKDGSSFDRIACRRRRGYQIGAKGAEYWVRDYFDALSQLRAMGSEARWRRPSRTSGTPGIVRVAVWK